MDALNGGSSLVRRAAALGLTFFGPEAYPVVAQALSSSDDDVRFYATGFLEKMPPSSVSMLTGMLRDRNEDVRRRAATTLSRLDPRIAAAGASELIRALQDESASVRRGAAHALGKIGDRAVGAFLPLLKVMCEDEDREVRADAGEALLDLGLPEEAEMDLAVMGLTKALAHNDEEVRRNVARIFSAFGPK